MSWDQTEPVKGKDYPADEICGRTGARGWDMWKHIPIPVIIPLSLHVELRISMLYGWKVTYFEIPGSTVSGLNPAYRVCFRISNPRAPPGGMMFFQAKVPFSLFS